MSASPIPQSWEARKGVTPDWAPQYDIYVKGEASRTAIVVGPHAEARARFIEVSPELLGMLEQMVAAAEEVAHCYEDGNLAASITALSSVRGEAELLIEKAKGEL